MSILSSIVKKAGKVLAPVVKIAAPVVGGILGGPAGVALGSAIGNVGNSALSGKSVPKNLANDVTSAAKTGALAYGGAKLLPALGPTVGRIAGAIGLGGGGNPSVGTAIPDGAWDTSGGTVQGGDAEQGQGILSTILGGAKSAAGSELERVKSRIANGKSPISMGNGGTAGGTAAAGATTGGTLGSILGKIGLGGTSAGELALGALGAAQGVQGAKAYGRMSDLQDKALATAEGSYAERAPARAAGLAGIGAAPVKLNLPPELLNRTALTVPRPSAAKPINLAAVTGNPMLKKVAAPQLRIA